MISLTLGGSSTSNEKDDLKSDSVRLSNELDENDTLDEEYDTDLECESESYQYDHTGKTLYLDLCKKAGIIPTSYYLRHMNDTNLNLRHFGLGAKGIKPICACLVGNTSVLTLDLTDNWLDVTGGTYICDMMRENCYISVLNLSDNQLDAEIAEVLAEVFGSNAQLTHLRLAGNKFCDKAAEYLAVLLGSSPRLLEMDLSRNDFGELAGVMFGRAIGENSVMLELDLSWNHIRGRGAKAIGAGLAINSTLKILNISWNGLGPSIGAGEIGKALKSNTCLEFLDISNNRISTEGVVLFSKGLTFNTALKTLKIGLNPIMSGGCYALISAILKSPDGNTAMEYLDIHDVIVTEEVRELEVLAKEQLPNLTIKLGPNFKVRQKTPAHPFVRLRRFVERNDLRYIDFYNNLGADHSLTMNKEEFVDIMAVIGLKLTDDDVDVLMELLDANKDGNVHYDEIIKADNECIEMEKLQNISRKPLYLRAGATKSIL